MARVRSNAASLVKAIAKRRAALEPRSPAMNEALQRVGVTLRNRMLMNATRQRIVDTGALRNSINYEVRASSVVVGSFGVRYARFHEFGAYLHPRAVRAMFAAMGRRSGPARPSKGVLRFGGDGSAQLLARPFAVPALKSESARVRAILAQLLGGS